MTTRWQITFVLVDDDDSPATALEIQNWLGDRLVRIATEGTEVTADGVEITTVVGAPYGIEDGVIGVTRADPVPVEPPAPVVPDVPAPVDVPVVDVPPA